MRPPQPGLATKKYRLVPGKRWGYDKPRKSHTAILEERIPGASAIHRPIQAIVERREDSAILGEVGRSSQAPHRRTPNFKHALERAAGIGRPQNAPRSADKQRATGGKIRTDSDD